MVKRKILILVLAFCMAFMMMPTMAFAADETVSTLTDLQTAIHNATGTKENPTVIVISGQIEVNQTIKIPAGKYIKLVGQSNDAGFIRDDSFTFTNGSITNRSHLLSVQGGLVLENITVDGNNKSGGSLVFIYGDNAFTEMNGGTTLRNNLNGAVKLYSQNSTQGNPCRFIMNDGTICSNSSDQGAGVAIPNYGWADFTMNGGEITGNKAASNNGGGGAIYSCANGTVTIAGGDIKNNQSTASDGGAMNVTGGSALVITGGEISGNHITASQRGGGIYKSGDAAFTMTGGVIKDNSTVKNDGREGQDIYIASGDFNLGGTAQIPDGLFIERYDNSNDEVNFYITSALQHKIGIEGLWTSPSAGRVVAVGKDYTITQSDFENISYNNESLVLKFDEDNNRIILGNPSYTVTYTLSNMTYSGQTELEEGNSLEATLTPSDGYHSPSEITVKIDGAELDKSNYQAVSVQPGGIGVYIPADYITGNVEILAKGASHYGGTATCIAQAICEGCSKSYGDIDSENHAGGIVWTRTETTHSSTYYCCGAIVVAEESHEWKNNVCSECGYVRKPTTIYYALHFETNGGNEIQSRVEKSGTTIDLSEYLPVRDGYTFTGWYADEDLTEQITEVKLDQTKTIYAGWEKDGPIVDPKKDQAIYMTVAAQERDLKNGSRTTKSKVCTLKLGFAVDDPDLSLTYTTSAPEVATVEDGKITYQGVGSCVITVTAKETALCKGTSRNIEVVVGKLGTPTFTPTVTANTAKKAFVVTSSTVRGVDGWEVQYSIRDDWWRATTKDFPDTGTKLYRKTCTTVHSDRIYYIRVRGYQIIEGEKVYSDWSPAKTTRTK